MAFLIYVEPLLLRHHKHQAHAAQSRESGQLKAFAASIDGHAHESLRALVHDKTGDALNLSSLSC